MRIIESNVEEMAKSVMTKHIKPTYEEIAEDYDSTYMNDLFWRVSDDITINHMMKWVPANGKVIDVGCGTGDYGLRFLKNGYEVDFCDLSPRMLHVVRNKIKREKVEHLSKVFEVDLCKPNFKLRTQHKYDVIIAEGDVLGYCMDTAPVVIRRLVEYLNYNGVLFIGVDNMILKVLSLAGSGTINEIDKFFLSHESRCPMDLPIKQYSIESFRSIIPGSLQLVEIVGKPIITPYLSEEKRKKILKDKKEYDKLISLEEKAIQNGYSSLGSHFTFVLQRNAKGVLNK